MKMQSLIAWKSDGQSNFVTCTCYRIVTETTWSYLLALQQLLHPTTGVIT
jgi:hypothetical protein